MGFKIFDGVLKKYISEPGVTEVVIPDGVTSIGSKAFLYCTSLTAVTIPDSVTSIGDYAFFNCASLTAVTIPTGVKKISEHAFGECTCMIAVTIPDSVTTIGEDAFQNCESLKAITVSDIFKVVDCFNNGTVLLIIEKKEENYRFYPLSVKSGNNNITDFIKKRNWNGYDLELINNGPKYKYRLQMRLLSGLSRLLDPIDLKEENKQLYIELLQKNVKKIISYSEEINCPFAVKSLFDLGIIDEKNIKAVKKLIAASSVPDIAAFAKTTLSTVSVPEKAEKEEKIDSLTTEYREKLAKIYGDTVIKKMKLAGRKLPVVKLSDGSDAPDELFRFIIASYGAQDKVHIDLEADKAAALLSYDSLCEAISLISNGFELAFYQSVIPLVCRFGNSEQIKAVINYYDTLNGVRGSNARKKIEASMVLNETSTGVLWLEKHEGLDKFAKLRHIPVEQAYDKYLFDFGFDEKGKRVFDLGNTTIEAEISINLSISLVNTKTGKAVRSIPKKDIDPAVHKKAADELSDIKESLKNAKYLKIRQLYGDYLVAKTYTAEEWKSKYIANPFLYAIARLLVWSQDENTFTLSYHRLINAQGKDYNISDKPIKIAHTMEMTKDDVENWQRYFNSIALRQPFSQIWEPVIDRQLFMPTRYENCSISSYYLKKHANLGISIWWYEFEYTERHKLLITDFDVHYDLASDDKDNVEIKYITPLKWNRRVNDVIACLDKLTVYGRIKKDDISTVNIFSSFTIAQITDFIAFAQKNKANNVLAALMDYKNKTYPNYDAMDEFVLDWDDENDEKTVPLVENTGTYNDNTSRPWEKYNTVEEDDYSNGQYEYTKDSLNGLRFGVTGDLDHYCRDGITKLIEECGGVFKDSISKKTNYVITNFPNSGTSKLKKAAEYGIPVISEAEFEKMVGKRKI